MKKLVPLFVLVMAVSGLAALAPRALHADEPPSLESAGAQARGILDAAKKDKAAALEDDPGVAGAKSEADKAITAFETLLSHPDSHLREAIGDLAESLSGLSKAVGAYRLSNWDELGAERRAELEKIERDLLNVSWQIDNSIPDLIRGERPEHLVTLARKATREAFKPRAQDTGKAAKAFWDEKIRAEQAAAALRSKFVDGDLRSIQALHLYIPAKAAVDGWLSAIKFGLVSGVDITASEYLEYVPEIARKSNLFVDYVQEQTGARFEASALAALSRKDLSDWLAGLIKEYKAADEAGKEEIKLRLDTLTWKHFR